MIGYPLLFSLTGLLLIINSLIIGELLKIFLKKNILFKNFHLRL